MSKAFHGWRIVGLGMIVNALSVGLFGAYGFMVTPLIEEFGATPGQLGLGMSITIFSMAAFGPLLGPLFDRGRMRATMLVGVGLMFVSMVVLSRGTSLWQLGVCLAFTALGMSMFGLLPAKVMIVNWFVRKRGTALSIALAGTSLAGFAMPPIIAWLIELLSWRGALVWLAAGAAVIAAPAILFLAIRRPEDVGQHPDGDPPTLPQYTPARAPVAASPAASPAASGPAPEPTQAAELPREPARPLSRDPNFWLVGAGEALAMCVPVATGLFFVRHLEEVGIPRTQIALVMPLMAVFSLVGKLSVGALADRMNPKFLAVVTLALHVTGLWIVALGTGLGTMVVAAVPLGLGGGGFFPIPGILQGACFGRLVIGRVSGLHGFMGLPLMLSAAPLAGLLASQTGSFVVPFLVAGAFQLIAAAVLVCVRVPHDEPGTLAAAGVNLS